MHVVVAARCILSHVGNNSGKIGKNELILSLVAKLNHQVFMGHTQFYGKKIHGKLSGIP